MSIFARLVHTLPGMTLAFIVMLETPNIAHAQCAASDSTGCCASQLCSSVYQKVQSNINNDLQAVRDALGASGTVMTEDERRELLLLAKQYFTAQKIDFITNRFGYGQNSAEKNLSVANPTDENLRRILFELTQDVEAPGSFLTPNLRRLANAYASETPNFRVPFNPIVMGPEQLALIHADVLGRRTASATSSSASDDDMDPAMDSATSSAATLDQQARQDASFLRSQTVLAASQFRILMSAFGSQAGTTAAQPADSQVNFSAIIQEFWFNHFNVDYNKIHEYSGFGAGGYEPMIRSKMTTTFYELLRSVITHPAMLKYLDNQNNFFASSALVASNQNLGREVMELHTLGMGPNRSFESKVLYTQKDVEGSALVLTGINLAPASAGFGLQINPLNHVPDWVGSKQTAPVVMGKRFCLLNSKVIDQADECPKSTTVYTQDQLRNKVSVQLTNYLRFLANHPRTKKNICTKLVTRFISPKYADTGIEDDSTTPQNESRAEVQRSIVVDRCVAAWGDDGDLKGIYTAVLTSPETWSRDNYRRYQKNPLELVVSAVRLSGLTAAHFQPTTHIPAFGRFLRDKVDALGLPYRRWMTPTGYQETSGWMSPGYFVRWLKASAEISNFFEIRSIGGAEMNSPIMGLGPNNSYAGSAEEACILLSGATTKVGAARLNFIKDLLGEGDLKGDPKNMESKIQDVLTVEQKMVKQKIGSRLYPVPVKTGLMLKTASFSFTRK